MKYSVGQVIYVILNKEMRIFPMQCVEEICKKTLAGEATSYVVQGGIDTKARVDISEVDGEIFDTAEKAKQALTERALANINRLVDAATQKAKEWYPNAFEATTSIDEVITKKRRQKRVETTEAIVEDQFNEPPVEQQMITLPDGTVAKVNIKIPKELMG